MKEPMIDPNTKTMVEGRAEISKSDIVSQKVCIVMLFINVDGFLCAW